MVTWQQTLLHWLVLNHDHPVLLVHYEELREDPKTSLADIFDFLHVPYSSDKLAQVTWAEEGREGVMERFGAQEVKYVNSVLKGTAEMLTHHSHTQDVNLTQYYYRFS